MSYGEYGEYGKYCSRSPNLCKSTPSSSKTIIREYVVNLTVEIGGRD